MDPALIRPGRIDVRVHFGNATKGQAYELFTKFYPNLPEKDSHRLASAFAAKVPDHQFSMAHLQGFLMGHKQSPAEAVDQIDAWIQSHQNKSADSSTTDQTVQDFDMDVYQQ